MQPTRGLAGRRTPGPTRAGALLDAALDIGVGRACAGCGCPGRQLCPACAAAMSVWTPEPSVRPGVGRFVAATRYEGLAARLLVAHKERGAVALSRPLGGALARAVLAVLRHDPAAVGCGAGLRRGAPGGPVLLVPVPSSPASRRRRGYDHTLRLARAAARDLRRGGVDARAAPLLVRAHAVRDQAELDLSDRARNQRGSMRVGARRLRRLGFVGPGTRIVVVDDIVTTGATAHEALRALAAVSVGGTRMHPLGVAAVAQTPRRLLPGSLPGRLGTPSGRSARQRPHSPSVTQNSRFTSGNVELQKSLRNT